APSFVATSARRSRCTSATTSRTPSPASVSAIARPIPLPAPVTTATFSRSSFMSRPPVHCRKGCETFCRKLFSDLPIIFPSSFNEKALDERIRRSKNETVAAPSPNERFGRYRLLKRIALGGMAEIWLAAEKVATDDGEPHVRTLVIKRILPH